MTDKPSVCKREGLTPGSGYQEHHDALEQESADAKAAVDRIQYDYETAADQRELAARIGDGWNAAHDRVRDADDALGQLKSEERWKDVPSETRRLVQGNMD